MSKVDRQVTTIKKLTCHSRYFYHLSRVEKRWIVCRLSALLE